MKVMKTWMAQNPALTFPAGIFQPAWPLFHGDVSGLSLEHSLVRAVGINFMKIQVGGHVGLKQWNKAGVRWYL